MSVASSTRNTVCSSEKVGIASFSKTVVATDEVLGCDSDFSQARTKLSGINGLKIVVWQTQ